MGVERMSWAIDVKRLHTSNNNDDLIYIPINSKKKVGVRRRDKYKTWLKNSVMRYASSKSTWMISTTCSNAYLVTRFLLFELFLHRTKFIWVGIMSVPKILRAWSYLILLLNGKSLIGCQISCQLWTVQPISGSTLHLTVFLSTSVFQSLALSLQDFFRQNTLVTRQKLQILVPRYRSKYQEKDESNVT